MKKKEKKTAGRVAQVVECLPSNHPGVQTPVPHTHKKKKKKKERKSIKEESTLILVFEGLFVYNY
jgi:hypothetical protein